FGQMRGLTIDVDTGGLGTDRMPPAVETALYRIMQEALSNVARHAGARHVRVQLDRFGVMVSMVVSDDGVGFDPDRPPAPATGAAGHVIKDAESAELLAAIRAVHRGRTFVQVGSEPATTATGERATPTLSPRERQVLGLLAHGHTNREVAERLSLSVKTVETHRARLSDKL